MYWIEVFYVVCDLKDIIFLEFFVGRIVIYGRNFCDGSSSICSGVEGCVKVF